MQTENLEMTERKVLKRGIATALAMVLVAGLVMDAEAVICKYCGKESSSVRALVTAPCPRHPAGVGKGKHAVFEGTAEGEYTCVYCGASAKSLHALVSVPCPRHPDGMGRGKHVPYEGSAKTKYTCKYCGATAASIGALVKVPCPRHPAGMGKGKHAPMR